MQHKHYLPFTVFLLCLVLLLPQVGLAQTFTRDLEFGAEGGDVSALQSLLIERGYTIRLGATGYFGNLTQDALAKFQKDNGITPALGYFGNKTRAALTNRTPVPNQPSTSTATTATISTSFTRDLDVGIRGDDVRALQKFLNSNGFLVVATGDGSPGNETTYFGAATRAALAKYQAAQGISPAIGFFGPKTRSVVGSSVSSTPNTQPTTTNPNNTDTQNPIGTENPNQPPRQPNETSNTNPASPVTGASGNTIQNTPVVTNGNTLVQYSTVPNAVVSSSYTVKINGSSVFVEKVGDVSYARFSFSGGAAVEVDTGNSLSSYTLSPKNTVQASTSNGPRASFTVTSPQQLIFQANGKEKLFIFADGLETNVPNLQSSNVINFASYLTANRDTSTPVTTQLQKAIDDASARGNASTVLYIPNGKYVTGLITMKSNVQLYLSSGTLLLAQIAKTNTTTYPLQNGSDSSFIYFKNANNSRIYGRGIIDGNGKAIRSQTATDGTLSTYTNIKLMRAHTSSNIIIEDVYLRDSARWTIQTLGSNNVSINKIKIINDLRGAYSSSEGVYVPFVTNTDGVDIDSSSNVVLQNSFIYTGDDAISLKTSHYMNTTGATTNVVMQNNVLWSLKAAIKIGDETFENISNVTFTNNRIVNADRALALWGLNGGNIFDIQFVGNRAEFIGGNSNERHFYFRTRPDGTHTPGYIKNVLIKDYVGDNASAQASTIESFSTASNVSNVTFDNSKIGSTFVCQKSNLPITYRANEAGVNFVNEVTDAITYKGVNCSTPVVPIAPVTITQTISVATASQLCTPLSTPPAPQQGGRTLTVDRRGGAQYSTIAAAIAAVQPGDTIWLARGSGPYQELVDIRKSGTPTQRIIFDGNCETITGSNPITFQFDTASGRWVYNLEHNPESRSYLTPPESPAYWPKLITRNGRRILLRYDGTYTDGTQNLDLRIVDVPGAIPAGEQTPKQLQLPVGMSPDGWAAGARTQAIVVFAPNSYQTYRNFFAQGAMDDGIGLYGATNPSHDIVFENFMSYQNFDEGFSAHGIPRFEINNAIFWGNDNGLRNASVEEQAMTARNVLIYANIGEGFSQQAGQNNFSNIRSWDNPAGNFYLGAQSRTATNGTLITSTLTCADLVTYSQRWTARPFKAHQEQSKASQSVVKPVTEGTVLPSTCPSPTVLSASLLPTYVPATATLAEAFPPPIWYPTTIQETPTPTPTPAVPANPAPTPITPTPTTPTTNTTPVVSTIAVTNLTSTGATLNGTVNANGGSDTLCVFSYRAVGTAYITTAYESCSGMYSLTLTNLTPGTTYNYRINAKNGSTGTSVNGAFVTFITPNQ